MKHSLNSNSIFVRYYPQFLLLIIAFTFFTRVYRLHVPEAYIFDEVYHAVTAKLMIDGDTRAYEWNNPPPEPNTAVDWLHPPYAKLTQAASMAIFGKNSFGWRFSSVIFGCLLVLVTAKIAEELFKNKQLALLSAFLISLDGLVFTMSRIAMNDIHVTFFILLSMWLYLKYLSSKRSEFKLYIYSSIAAGFAVGSKWSGIFAIGFIACNEIVHLMKLLWASFLISKKKKQIQFRLLKSHVLKQLGLLIITCLIIPAVLYLGSYSQMFLLGKDFNHLKEMHKNTWWYQTNLTATHPAQSKPLQWFLNTKPVWLSVHYTKNMRGDIYAVGNPALFWLGDIAVFATLFTIIVKRFPKKIKLQKLITIEKDELSMLGILLFAYVIVWLPWQLSPRIMFFYHYLPAVPLLTINLTYWIMQLWKIKNFKILSALLVAVIFIAFVVWYPHLTQIPVSTELKEQIYFYFNFWKQS